MTTRPETMQPQAPASAKLKPLPFAFPFLPKGRGASGASSRFTNEREIHRLLAEREPTGTYLVSRDGLWHGGIHVTEAGAGQALDLDAGLRCIADGVLIAFRANKTYPVSEMAADGNESPVQAPYSTGFALVRHTMEFPRGNELTFYSVYMHLMSCEDYACFPQRDKPWYWPRQWTVTQHAQDKPSPGRNGQLPEASQQGLRVRKAPDGTPIGIVPQGASVSIGKQEKSHGHEWGQVTDLHGASLHPPQVGGYVEPSSAIGGWIYLGQENGGPVVREHIADDVFDRVIVTTNRMSTEGGLQGAGAGGGVPINAGDLIGHLGRYDSLSQGTSGTRMAHIEVFCDDSIQPFLERSRAWIGEHSPHKEDWDAVGLPGDPTILRLEPGTVLYQRTSDDQFIAGVEPQLRKADVVQVYSLAELGRSKEKKVTERAPDKLSNRNVSWWHVESANALGHPIEGWVREFNHPGGGRVTCEFGQKWIDFQCLADTHDPAHTIFVETGKWVDYKSGAEVADRASRSKLSPLMLKAYDALFRKGDGKQAADELRMLSHTVHGGYPWLMQAASRLIVKHESEWANPSKWKQLIAELEKHTGQQPQHEEELRRIEKLAWWDEVRGRVAGFPGAEVFHINPIGLAANLGTRSKVACVNCGADLTVTSGVLRSIFPSITDADAEGFGPELNSAFKKYAVDTCHKIAHFFGQCEVECSGFTKFREDLTYKDGERLWKTYRSALTAGLRLLHPKWSILEIEVYAKTRLINNDSELGFVLFGDTLNTSVDYRGRGLLHLTWRENYQRYKTESNIDVVSHPFKVESDRHVAVDSSAWYWSAHSIGALAEKNDVRGVTRKISPALKHIERRRDATRLAFNVFNPGRSLCRQEWELGLKGEYGW